MRLGHGEGGGLGSDKDHAQPLESAAALNPGEEFRVLFVGDVYRVDGQHRRTLVLGQAGFADFQQFRFQRVPLVAAYSDIVGVCSGTSKNTWLLSSVGSRKHWG